MHRSAVRTQDGKREQNDTEEAEDDHLLTQKLNFAVAQVQY